jgi:hypothetical protein
MSLVAQDIGTQNGQTQRMSNPPCGWGLSYTYHLHTPEFQKRNYTDDTSTDTLSLRSCLAVTSVAFEDSEALSRENLLA